MKYELTEDETRRALRTFLRERGVPVEPEDEIGAQGERGMLTVSAGPGNGSRPEPEETDPGERRLHPVEPVDDPRFPEPFQGRTRRWPSGWSWDPAPLVEFLERNPEVTIADLAEVVGVAQPCAYDWPTGKRDRRPGVGYVQRLAEELDRDPRTFLTREGEGETDE